MAIPNFHSSVLNALGSAGMDGAAAVIDNATKVVLLTAEAASFAEADTNFGTGAGKKVAEATITAGDFSVSGTGLARKVSFAGKGGGTVTVNGPVNPTVIAFLDGSIVLAQLTETGAANFVSGNSVTFPGLDVLAFGSLS